MAVLAAGGGRLAAGLDWSGGGDAGAGQTPELGLSGHCLGLSYLLMVIILQRAPPPQLDCIFLSSPSCEGNGIVETHYFDRKHPSSV